MASSLVHPHVHRRLWLESSGTHFLLSLGEACDEISLPRLERLVQGAAEVQGSFSRLRAPITWRRMPPSRVQVRTTPVLLR